MTETSGQRVLSNYSLGALVATRLGPQLVGDPGQSCAHHVPVGHIPKTQPAAPATSCIEYQWQEMAKYLIKRAARQALFSSTPHHKRSAPIARPLADT